MIAKRCFDFVVALISLVLLAPLFAAVALWIKVDSPGPVFFRQERVGRFGRRFRIHKFRTMRADAEQAGLQITVGADQRITASGRWLRKHKLDELAQLIDVVSGKMSLVGPRPEVPRYVDLYPEHVRSVVLSVRPGITDHAAIAFKDENRLLENVRDPEQRYVEEILPVKLSYYQHYVLTRSSLGDLWLIARTLSAIVSGEPARHCLRQSAEVGAVAALQPGTTSTSPDRDAKRTH